MDKNLPNYLTVARIIAIPLIVMTFYFEDSALASRLGAGIFMLAGLTDFLDGYLARKFNLVSPFGRMLDPIADKVLVGCVIVMLVKTNKAGEIPCLLILAREFAVAGLREFLAQITVSLPVSRLAKLKTAIQMFSLTLLILGSQGSGYWWLDYVANFFLWLTAFLTVLTGYSYIQSTSKYFR